MKETSSMAKFMAGVGLGMFLGMVMSKNKPRRPRRMLFKAWQEMLVDEFGPVKAAFLTARVQKRYRILLDERPHFSAPVLNKHLVQHILPGLALYQELLESGMGQDVALETVEPLITSRVLQRRKQFEQIGQQPFFFAFLRKMMPLTMRDFPQAGWDIEWLETSDQRIAFNVYDCFYLNILTEYGAPELTPVYCKSDDAMLEGISPYMRWERSKTLGRGDELCDFCFLKIEDGRQVMEDSG